MNLEGKLLCEMVTIDGRVDSSTLRIEERYIDQRGLRTRPFLAIQIDGSDWFIAEDVLKAISRFI